MGSLCWILGCVLDIDHHKSGLAAVRLAAKDATHALDHLTSATRGRDDYREIRLWDIDPLVEYARGRHGLRVAILKRLEQPLARFV